MRCRVWKQSHSPHVTESLQIELIQEHGWFDWEDPSKGWAAGLEDRHRSAAISTVRGHKDLWAPSPEKPTRAVAVRQRCIQMAIFAT